MALTDKLTAIANAIREKGGTSEPLTLDQMAAAITAIEAGGGANIKMGSFTLSQTADSYTLTHGLGAIPQFIMLMSNCKTTTPKGALVCAYWNGRYCGYSATYSDGTPYNRQVITSAITNAHSSMSSSKGVAFWKANANTVLIQACESSWAKLNTDEYYWIAF